MHALCSRNPHAGKSVCRNMQHARPLLGSRAGAAFVMEWRAEVRDGEGFVGGERVFAC